MRRAMPPMSTDAARTPSAPDPPGGGRVKNIAVPVPDRAKLAIRSLDMTFRTEGKETRVLDGVSQVAAGLVQPVRSVFSSGMLIGVLAKSFDP